MIKLESGEVLEDLQLDGLKILQNKNLYRFTSDPVILANFVRAKRGERLLDIGTGSGIIPILVSHKTTISSAVGVEIQPQMAEMAKKSVALNGFDGKIEIVQADIKNFTSQKQFDIITCNPPYKKEGTSKPNENISKRIARHEECLNLVELCKAVKRLLKFGGRFYVCIDALRTAELIFELKTCGLEPKKMFFTQPSSAHEASIVFIEAVCAGKEGLRVLPVLIVNDQNGKYLETVKKMRF